MYSTPPHDLPLRPGLNKEGEPARIRIPLGDRIVYANVFIAQVGRIPIYLLDTDCEPNTAEDRAITRNLYGGGVETRIKQEVLLGIGGFVPSAPVV